MRRKKNTVVTSSQKSPNLLKVTRLIEEKHFRSFEILAELDSQGVRKKVNIGQEGGGQHKPWFMAIICLKN